MRIDLVVSMELPDGLTPDDVRNRVQMLRNAMDRLRIGADTITVSTPLEAGYYHG